MKNIRDKFIEIIQKELSLLWKDKVNLTEISEMIDLFIENYHYSISYIEGYAVGYACRNDYVSKDYVCDYIKYYENKYKNKIHKYAYNSGYTAGYAIDELNNDIKSVRGIEVIKKFGEG